VSPHDAPQARWVIHGPPKAKMGCDLFEPVGIRGEINARMNGGQHVIAVSVVPKTDNSYR
jgi:hypothetical protein